MKILGKGIIDTDGQKMDDSILLILLYRFFLGSALSNIMRVCRSRRH